MRDTKLLQAILNNQVSMRQDIKNLDKKMDIGFKEVNGRIDKLGKSLAYLEEDTPTNEEFDNLEKRVRKVEKKLFLA